MAPNAPPDETEADRLKRRGAEARAFVARVDPSLFVRATEVDESLIDWALSLTPAERLDHNTAFARFVDGVR